MPEKTQRERDLPFAKKKGGFPSLAFHPSPLTLLKEEALGEGVLSWGGCSGAWSFLIIAG